MRDSRMTQYATGQGPVITTKRITAALELVFNVSTSFQQALSTLFSLRLSLGKPCGTSTRSGPIMVYLFAFIVLATRALALVSPEQRVLAAGPKKYSVQTPPLDTNWTYEVGTAPWPQYPRPKLVRSRWQSLNGIWTYSYAAGQDELSNPPFNQTLSQEVLVPFCLESGLSGIQAASAIHSWYRTTFEVPYQWRDGRVLLNFGAVDYEATIFVNGRKATFHRGGYSAFSADVTDYLNGKHNELCVFSHS